MVMVCKKCHGEHVVKNGFVRGKQRYLCKDCQCNFVDGDGRRKLNDPRKPLAVLLCTMCKASFNFLATKVFQVSPTTVMNWVKEYADSVEMPEISGDIQEVELDEMWHFIDKKKRNCGLSKPLIVAQGSVSPGLQAIVILQHLNDFTAN
jgi:transposase